MAAAAETRDACAKEKCVKEKGGATLNYLPPGSLALSAASEPAREAAKVSRTY